MEWNCILWTCRRWRRRLFRCFGIQNALLTVGAGDKINTMTIGWGPAGNSLQPAGMHRLCAAGAVYVLLHGGNYDLHRAPSCPRTSGRCWPSAAGSAAGRWKTAHCGAKVVRGAGEAPISRRRSWCWCAKLYVQDLDPACVTDERASASIHPRRAAGTAAMWGRWWRRTAGNEEIPGGRSRRDRRNYARNGRVLATGWCW